MEEKEDESEEEEEESSVCCLSEEKWKKNVTDKCMTANPTLKVGKVSIH